MSIFAVEMPIAAAMRRFCVTARIRGRKRRVQDELNPYEDKSRQHDDPQAVGRDREAAESQRPDMNGGLLT